MPIGFPVGIFYTFVPMKRFAFIIFISLLVACSANKQFTSYSEKDMRCRQLPDAGRCKAYMPSYYYDSISGKCKEFIYGGCGGSRPFVTLEDCEKSCGCDRKKTK